ncbi:MAG TPA: histidine kinase dimerization/phospho-acceptor domain-containing protein, partial [Longimicrobiaceae bacterium]|nr:histidine kinase dimerization/phospho-acceptor domain-containing protein [Longimicrobiaceae bacterium]
MSADTLDSDRRDERILILAPIGRDAALARATLQAAGITALIIRDMEALCRELASGAGGLLLTQEALAGPALEQLLAALGEQLPWSDLPLVVLVSGGVGTAAITRLTEALGQQANATFLERPMRAATLVGAVEVALRSRRRQYELRGHLQARAEAEAAERRARTAAEEASRIRDHFIASVAHDLKHPLAVMKGYAQLLRRRTRSGSISATAASFDASAAEGLVDGLSRIED